MTKEEMEKEKEGAKEDKTHRFATGAFDIPEDVVENFMYCVNTQILFSSIIL